MRFNHRIPASALLLTLVIVLILGILSSALLLAGYYNRQYGQVAVINQRLNRNMASAINYVLADSVIEKEAQTARIDLFGEGRDSVLVKRYLWGVFEVAALTAFYNRFSQERHFLYGAALPAYMDGCVYLADHKRPLSLIGKTKLTGDAYLSKAGLKASFINQRGFDYARLLEGKVKNSEEELPAFDAAMVKHLVSLKYKDSGAYNYKLVAGDSLVRHFDEPVLYLASNNAVHLGSLQLSGQVIIQSDSLITVDASSRLSHVILVAPAIRIGKGCSAVLQAIATDSIVVEADCALDYPSALVLLKDSTSRNQPLIRLEDRSKVNGLIISHCSRSDLSKTYVSAASGSHLNGILYVMGYTSLNGRITGTVLTDYFIYKSGASIYENHLVDVEIDRRQLSKHFIGTAFFAGTRDKKIIEWLK